MTTIEQAAKALAEDLGLWPSPKNLGIITRHLTTFTKPLEEEIVRIETERKIVWQTVRNLEDENKRLREALEKAEKREMELLWKLGTINKTETKPEYDGGLYE